MNCDWTKENVVLYIYGELADDAKFEFEQHVRHCLGCRRELDASLEFKDSMAALPVKDVSPSFLAANRMELQEHLEHAEQSRNIFSSLVFDLSAWMHQIKLAPALTAALLMIGFAGGVGTTYRMMDRNTPRPGGVDHSIEQPITADVAQIESITPDANSNQIQIKYNTLQSQTLSGSMNDPRVKQLLLLAARNNRNSSLVLDSVDVLTRGQEPEDDAVREALIYALRYDKNPGVRLKVLDGLKSYVKDDVHVRDAVVEALLHDSNAGVRQEAISLLDAVKADSSVRGALTQLAEHDSNKFIREESKRYLASTPHLD